MRTRHRILKSQLRDVVRRAVRVGRSRQREIAGVLIFNGHVLGLLECGNMARRRGGFQLSAQRLREVEVAARCLGARVVGTFHSHVGSIAEPGPGDIVGAYRELMLIIDTVEPETRLWRVRRGRAYEIGFDVV